jgi:hypothetical protein
MDLSDIGASCKAEAKTKTKTKTKAENVGALCLSLSLSLKPSSFGIHAEVDILPANEIFGTKLSKADRFWLFLAGSIRSPSGGLQDIFNVLQYIITGSSMPSSSSAWISRWIDQVRHVCPRERGDVRRLKESRTHRHFDAELEFGAPSGASLSDVGSRLGADC